MSYDDHSLPLVSIVIPAYNEEATIAATLLSIQRQTYKNFELLVVDNNSNDNTADIAKRHGARVIKEMKKSIAAARNTGFFQAKGEIIATTDADTLVPENWIEHMVQVYQKDTQLVGFGGIYYLASGPLIARLAIKYLLYPYYALGHLFSRKWILMCSNMSVKADSFRKTGGFDLTLVQGEDIDISQKLSTIGKILLQKDFYVLTSGRRYDKGLIRALMSYGLNWPIKVLFKKDTFQRFEDIR